MIINKFIKNLRKITCFQKIDFLNFYHFEQINDKVFELTNNRKNNFFQIFLPKIKFLKNIIVFDPSKKLKLCWDLIMVLLTIFQFFIIPIDLTFEISFINLYIPNFWSINLFLFILDIIINFNTGFFLKGSLTLERNEIFQNYIKKSFFTDLITCFSICNLIPRTIFDLIFFVRIINFKRILRNLRQYIMADDIIHNTINLFTHFFNVLLLAHFFACIWFWIGKQSENNWIQENNLKNSIWYEQYLYAYYFTVITMNTVGYGI